jgi:hypothetical protein
MVRIVVGDTELTGVRLGTSLLRAEGEILDDTSLLSGERLGASLLIEKGERLGESLSFCAQVTLPERRNDNNTNKWTPRDANIVCENYKLCKNVGIIILLGLQTSVLY